MRTHAVLQNAVLVLYFTDFSQQTAISHAQHLESTSPTQNRGLHVRLCSGASVIFQIRNVCLLSPVNSESLCLFLFLFIRPSAPCSRTFLVSSPPENVAAGASSRPALIYCTGLCVAIYSFYSLYTVVLLSYKDICVEIPLSITYSVILELLTLLHMV